MRQLNHREQLIFNELQAHEYVHPKYLAILIDTSVGNLRDWYIKYLVIKIQDKYRVEKIRHKGYRLREKAK